MKPKTKKKPLRFYLATGFLIFSALLLVVLWLFQTVFLEAFYKSIKTGQVKSCAYSISDRVDSDELSDTIAEIEEQNNMSIAIYNTDEKFFKSCYLTKDRPEMHSMVNLQTAYELYDMAMENNGEYSRISQNTDDRYRQKRDFNNNFNNGTTPADPFEPSTSTEVESASTAPTASQESSSVTPTESTVDDSDAASDIESETEPTTEDDFLLNNPDSNYKNNDFNKETRDPVLERRIVDNLAFAKIVTTDTSEYLVIVESEITPVTSVVDTLRCQLIIMTVVIVVLSVVIAIIVANTISKPISDATKKAKELADQNYDLTFSGGKYREITELNDTLSYAAQELKKVDALQKELIANISHDLRTPLTMITGYAEVMRDLPGEATPENVQIIIDEASRLNNLVTDLLDISRLRSGTADLKMQPFSLTNCIKNIFSRYQKLVENDGLNIVFEHDNREVFVNGDELRMTQVLYNLVNNAVNYIGDDKTVIVRQTIEGDLVKIEVIDHGEGIPQEKLDYIWDRYYRVDKEHQRAVIGSGLGLSIVKNILLAHDADFGVASKLGSGSDFYFSLPIIDVENEKE